MNSHETNFKLPRNIEHYLALLSKLYAKDGKKQLQEIIVNAQVRVHEGWSYDNWNGGISGHALYFALPETLYLNTVKQKDDFQEQIREDINEVHNIQNEFIERVFLEIEIIEDQDWRKESDLLMTGKRFVLPDTEKRIWEDGGYRLFLSHKTEVKKEVVELKEKLKLFGISSFVAHVDIHPTKEWQDEIENALSSMDALVAILTEGFHDSLWTDQEVGFAFGRGVPIISVRLGKDPYGFIGKFQALSCSWVMAAKEVTKILVKNNSMLNAYIKAVQNCRSFDHGNILAEILPCINSISEQQVKDLLYAFNENSDVRGSFGFNGARPKLYGDGLAYHLSRLTGRTYKFRHPGKIEVIP